MTDELTPPVEQNAKPMAAEIVAEIMDKAPPKKRGRPPKPKPEPEPVPAPPPSLEPTPETDAAALFLLANGTAAMSAILGPGILLDEKRDAFLVMSWSRYFAFKGWNDIPPHYLVVAATVAFVTGRAMSKEVIDHVQSLRHKKSLKPPAQQQPTPVEQSAASKTAVAAPLAESTGTNHAPDHLRNDGIGQDNSRQIISRSAAASISRPDL